jgi:tRNA pseudouridine13 synthase
MKLKQQPDDFRVEEITRIVPENAGVFAFYRMEKRGWSTPDALAAIRRRWQVEPQRLSYGGLKDRHAWTTQYLTINHGPRRGMNHQQITLHYLGQLRNPYTAHDIDANRFQLTLRDLVPADQERMQARIAQVAVEGVPNYFDDQRFGSVAGEGEEFIGRLLVRGRFEEALKLALAGRYDHDRAEQKREKQTLVTYWGNWDVCKDKLPRGHARSLVDYLRVHPGDFRGAVARLRPELRGLYLSAYQSHLWNRMLASWLRQHCLPEQLRPVALRLGEAPFHVGLTPEQQADLASLLLPLPSARLKIDESDPFYPLLRAVLEEESLELKDLQVRGIREMFFSRGERSALCVPQGLTAEFADDDLQPRRLKATLGFELPRGCYATLIVKGVTAPELDRSSPSLGPGEAEVNSQGRKLLE